MNEKKIVGASYIYSFSLNVQDLTSTYANYSNLMSELEYKYGTDAAKASDPEKATVNQFLQNLRFLVHTTYIQYRSISTVLKSKNEDIETSYGEITSQYMIDREKVRHYVEMVNSELFKSVIQDILATNQDLLSEIYGQQPNKQ